MYLARTIRAARITILAAAAMTALLLTAAMPAAARGKGADTLRILAIGNSFSDDAMEYLPALLDNLGVENVSLARLFVAGCSLERHMKMYDSDEAAYQYYRSEAGRNRWVKAARTVSLRQALADGEWDIVVMQQASGFSGRYESYEPYLDSLIAAVRRAQPRARLAWHMTWAYASGSSHAQFADYGRDRTRMYDAICDAVRQMLDEHPHTFRYLIPSGAVIESLRLSEVNNPPMDFTRDGYHMDFGAGRYALACTWYEVLIRPFTHRTMRNNSLLSIWGEMKVDDRMASYCRQAAWRAARGPRRKVFEARAVTKPTRARWKGHIDVVSQDMTIYEK